MEKYYAISSTGKSEKSFLDLRFGKCLYIALYQPASDNLSIIENPFIEAEHSGIKLVDFLAGKGVTTIVTGEVGPMVSAKLEKIKMQLVLLHEEKIKIDEIISRFKAKTK